MSNESPMTYDNPLHNHEIVISRDGNAVLIVVGGQEVRLDSTAAALLSTIFLRYARVGWWEDKEEATRLILRNIPDGYKDFGYRK
jgi:hypothetical protein